MANNCNGVVGKLLGHNYQPRYSYRPPNNIRRIDGHSIRGSELAIKYVQAMTRKFYEGDVCTRCGSRVVRPPIDD